MLKQNSRSTWTESRNRLNRIYRTWISHVYYLKPQRRMRTTDRAESTEVEEVDARQRNPKADGWIRSSLDPRESRILFNIARALNFLPIKPPASLGSTPPSSFTSRSSSVLPVLLKLSLSLPPSSESYTGIFLGFLAR